MKVAIVGTGLVGMQAALFFQAMDCAVVLMGAEGERPLGGELARMGAIFPELQSSLTMHDLDQNREGTRKLTYGEVANFCKSLGNSLEEQGLLLRCSVTLIRKCTLSQDGPLQGNARMKDLFRLHYKTSGFESFIDVDVVIDARGPGRPSGLSLDGAQALGERNINSARFIYGIPTLEQWQSVEKDFQSMSDPVRILIVGSGHASLFLFLKWVTILKNTQRNLSLTVLSSEEKFYADLKKAEENTALKAQIEEAINWGHQTYQQRYEKYHQELKKWEELEEYIQVKMPRPAPPRFQIEFIGNAQVQSIDAPLDRKDFFLTYETARWDNQQLLNQGPFTIAGDFIFVANKRFQGHDSTVSLHPKEAGFYDLRKGPALKDSLLKLELIKQDLSLFFHRA